MTYKFKYRRFIFWRSFTLMGHHYDNTQNKMVVYFPDGSCQEIKRWNLHEVKLGTDWVVAVKKDMENKAGMAIPLNVGK